MHRASRFFLMLLIIVQNGFLKGAEQQTLIVKDMKQQTLSVPLTITVDSAQIQTSVFENKEQQSIPANREMTNIYCSAKCLAAGLIFVCASMPFLLFDTNVSCMFGY